jgi:signal peptidase
MNLRLIRHARRVVILIGIALFLVLIGFSLCANLAPLTGRQLFVITGGSMEPTIPLGSLVVVNVTDPMTIVPGDIVTIRADNGVIVTHRVSRIVDQVDGRVFEIEGDANDSPDAGLVPSRAIVGVVAQSIPYAGYARAFLAKTSGMIAVIAVLGVLYVVQRALGIVQPAAMPATARPPIASP